MLGAPIRALYLGAIVLALCTYLLGKKKDWQGKHLDYRCLSEALRVQFFWKAAGIDNSAADKILRAHQSELDWIGRIIRYTELKALNINDKPSGWKELKFVLREWVDEQFYYFAGDRLKHIPGSAELSENKNRLYSKAAATSLVFGLLMVLAILVLPIFGFRDGQWAQWTPVMRIFSVILLVLSGSLKGYATFMAFAEHARSYEKMGFLFGKGKIEIEKCIDRSSFTDARNVILELGKEALAENGEWIVLHRARPISLPRGIRIG